MLSVRECGYVRIAPAFTLCCFLLFISLSEFGLSIHPRYSFWQHLLQEFWSQWCQRVDIVVRHVGFAVLVQSLPSDFDVLSESRTSEAQPFQLGRMSGD